MDISNILAIAASVFTIIGTGISLAFVRSPSRMSSLRGSSGGETTIRKAPILALILLCYFLFFVAIGAFFYALAPYFNALAASQGQPLSQAESNKLMGPLFAGVGVEFMALMIAVGVGFVAVVLSLIRTFQLRSWAWFFVILLFWFMGTLIYSIFGD